MVTDTRTPSRLRPLSALGGGRRPPRADAGAVALVTLGAFVLRVTQLHQSLFGDEVLAWREITGHSLSGTVHAVGTGVESSPPLFFILAWLSAKLGDPTVWIRLPSLLLGTATIPVVYLLGRATVGRRAGLLAAAITALSPFATYYGIEARPYATTEFFVALSTLALLHAVRGGRPRAWALYAVATAAAAYSHYTAIFVLVAQAGWSAWVCRHRLAPALVAHGGAAILYLPWLPSLHGSDLGTYALLEPLRAGNVVRDVVRPVAGYAYTSLQAIPGTVGCALIAACALAGAAGLAARHRAEPPRAEHVLVALLALATPVGLLLYSVLGTDIWSPRSLIASAPAQTLVLAALVLAVPRRGRIVAVAVTLAVLTVGTIRAVTPRFTRPPYRTIAELIDRAARPADLVELPSAPFVLDQAIPVQFKRPHTTIAHVVTRLPARPPGTRLFLVYEDGAIAYVRSALRPPGWTRVDERHWHGLVDLTMFVYRAR